MGYAKGLMLPVQSPCQTRTHGEGLDAAAAQLPPLADADAGANVAQRQPQSSCWQKVSRLMLISRLLKFFRDKLALQSAIWVEPQTSCLQKVSSTFEYQNISFFPNYLACVLWCISKKRLQIAVRVEATPKF